MQELLCLLGLLLIVEGLPYFAFPGRIKRWIAAILSMPDAHLRAVGFCAMALGLLITYLSRK